MKTWEEAEFEMQQKSIKEWAEKKFWKTLDGWLLKRKLKKLQRLAGVASDNKTITVYMAISPGSANAHYGYAYNKTYYKEGSVIFK